MTAGMLLSIAGVLLGAKIAAHISHRLGLPAVLGELLLGLIIGPSVLGWLAPNETLHLLAEIGVILLMFMAGVETDVAAMRRVGPASLLTAIGGVIVPLGSGLVAGLAFGLSWTHALFMGAVLTATSVSISAQTLREMGKLRTREGTTILGAAIIDDVLAVLIFAVVMGLAGRGNLLLTLGRMVIFLPVAWVVGNWVVPALLRWERQLHHREASLAVFLSLILAYAWAAEILGSVATITGAYLLGVIVARHVDLDHIIHSGITAIGYGFFIPLFFVNIGLQTHSVGLLSAPLLTGLLILIATLSKIIGSGLGVRLGGFGWRSALQVGSAMVSRGEVALVMAGAGFAAGLLDSGLFSIIVVVTIATTLLTPPLLRLTYVSVSPSVWGSLSRALHYGARWQDFVLEE